MFTSTEDADGLNMIEYYDYTSLSSEITVIFSDYIPLSRARFIGSFQVYVLLLGPNHRIIPRASV
jgi:hypothetical protein